MRSTTLLSDDWQIGKASGWTSEELSLVLAGNEPGTAEHRWYTASAPTGLHEVLLREGEIADPHNGKNAAAADWVGEEDWAFRHRFATPALTGGPVLLTFLGVDTLADAYLNGKHIQTFDNMFREWSVPVGGLLAAEGEENVLVVVIRSATKHLRHVTVRPESHRNAVRPSFYIRKGGGDFSEYLGARPQLAKVGLWRDVVLTVTDGSWLEDVRVRTLSIGEHAAVLQVDTELGGDVVGTQSWTLTGPDGAVVAQGQSPAAESSWTIDVPDPELWWPRTHGAQPLYRLEVSLADDSGAQLDNKGVTVGLREVQLLQADPETGEARFSFIVNDVPIYLKGANWAQLEGISNVWNPTRAKRLFELAELSDMNVLRVWGGGVIPEDDFYEECNRRGFVVWQDFMLEYGMYPVDMPDFAATLELELAQNVKRLRNQPCIFLWCGGNESHMGWDFQHGGEPDFGGELFTDTMPRITAEGDGTRPFHANSPFGGRVANWPLEGDWHDYTTVSYSHRSSMPTFVSEMGRVSAPSLASMKKFMSPEELWPAGHDGSIRTPGQESWPPMWGYRAPNGAWDKIGPIEEFSEPSTAYDYIRALGTAHGEYLLKSVSRHRRGVPNGTAKDGQTVARRNGGDMVWRLNDPWPILYWSVIDSYLEPKIPFYFLRRAYAPVLVSFEQTPDELAVWVTNDGVEEASGRVTLQRLGFDGRVVGELGADVSVAPGESLRVLETVNLGPIPLRSEFLRATFLDQEATWLLIGERYLHLPQATLTVEPADGGFTVTSDVFARQVTLEKSDALGDAILDDNYFDLAPGKSRTVRVIGGTPGSVSVSAVNAHAVELTLPSGSGDGQLR